MIRLAKLMNPWRVLLTVIFISIQVMGMLLMPTITANIIDFGVAEGDFNYIIRMGVVMLGITFMNIAMAGLNVYFSATESQGLGETLRNKMYKVVSYFANEELNKFGTSTLITRTTNDIMQIQFITMLALRMMIMAPIMMVGAAFMAYQREPQLAIVFVVSIPLLAVLLGLILKYASPYFRSLQLKTDRLNRIFREGLTGIRVIRAFNTSKYEEDRFNEANEDFRDTAITGFTIMGFLMPSMTFAISITNILIITYGAQLISTGDMQVGNMVAFLTYAMQILIGIMNVSMVLFFLPRGQVAAERIIEVLDTPQSIIDPEQPKEVKAGGEISLEFDHVNFRYIGAEKLALEDIHFSAEKGETVAIIGGTGSGKTTLSNLLLRLFDLESGNIRINGVDTREMSQHSLRDLIGYAPQKALLFSGTIRENMQYGKADATDEEIWHALEIAQGADFVSSLPDGLGSRVEQGGSNFSGGQRQRLSIARALVTQADIFIFDDSFSALDFKTDAALRKALKPETTESIVVLIAQRINTVIDADTILVLDNGQLVGKGTHEELKTTNKVYQDIMDSQMKGETI